MEKPQLFLVHFAGGNRYSFQFLAPYLRDFELVPLELPGRGKRMGEPLLRDFDLAAVDLYNQVLERLYHRDFLIYGHSMGAYLALRIANMLEKAGRPPACLLVSGNAGPGTRERQDMHKLDPGDFIVELKKMGGIPEEVTGDHELFRFFEPVLRADFEIVEKNDMSNEQATGAPLFAMMGDQEENAGKISCWERYTRSQFGCEILEGDHFFIHRHPARVASIIINNYCKLIC